MIGQVLDMSLWFLVFAAGFIFTVPLHFWSVEHCKLQTKYGKNGVKFGKILGALSGWTELLFIILLWIAPQPRFLIPILPNLPIQILLVDFSVPISHLLIGLPLLLLGGWIAIGGVKTLGREVGFEVVDTHSKPRKIVRSWPYSVVRHPQYLGAVLDYFGGLIFFSAFYALIFTPVYILCNYLISWKEEEELLKDLGDEYRDYREKVPMFIPKFQRR